MTRPVILVCNDDGIDSPGLRAAAEASARLGTAVVVAPARQQTSAGRALWSRPGAALEPVDYRLGRERLEAYRIDASPATSVRHAMLTLFARRRPGLVVSGVNYGENVGVNLACSGTVGAALEAAHCGVPALAVSVQTAVEDHRTYGELDWAAARHFTEYFAAKLLGRRFPRDVDVLNVNVPASADAGTPWRLTRASRQGYYALRLPRPSRGSKVSDAKLSIEVDIKSLEDDSDIRALAADRVVSVTALSMDLTSRRGRAALGAWLAGASPDK